MTQDELREMSRLFKLRSRFLTVIIVEGVILEAIFIWKYLL